MNDLLGRAIRGKVSVPEIIRRPHRSTGGVCGDFELGGGGRPAGERRRAPWEAAGRRRRVGFAGG